MAKRRKRYKKPLKLNLKKGAFRNYVQRNYGKKGFTSDGKIKVSVARKIANNPKVNETTRRRARFMLNARKWRK
ncbi:MAG: hypothetical protein ACTSO2_13735 [Promethearchaeota archaeon]